MPAPKRLWPRRAAGVSVAALVVALAAAPPALASSHPAATPASVAGLVGAGSYGGVTAGANVPFTEYEAENARTNGTVLGPDRAFSHLPSEASGRRAVTLAGHDAFVEFTLAKPANAVDLRYSIPDSSDGTGRSATLSLYVNGHKEKALPLSSAYSWVYGNYPYTNNPADGAPHHFFDDVRTLFGRTLPAGTRVRLQVDRGDTAPWYALDVADFEQVAPAAHRPAGFLDVTTFGADPTGGIDSTGAIQAALDAGRAQGQGVWLPAGTFTVTGQLHVDAVTLRGAGPWWSVLHGAGVGVFGNGAASPSAGVHLADFAILGETKVRDDSTSDSGLGGALGGSSTVDNLWIEHTKVGAWFDGPSDGLSLTRLRIQNTMADGVNLHNGVGHTTVSDSFVRNTGDDAMAMWSDQNADHDNAFSHNTVVAPLLANAYAIYGGHDNAISANIGADTVTQGGGAHVGNRFGAVALSGTTTIDGNILVRTGDLIPNYPTTDSAIWFYADDSPMTGTVNVTNDVALDSSYAAVQFVGKTITGVHVDRLLIAGAGTFAVQLQAPGAATFSHVVATGVRTAGVYDCASGFTITKGPGNAGWNSTRCGFPPLGQLLLVPDPATLAFGDQALNTSATQHVTVANPGPTPIQVTAVTAPAGYTLANHCATIRVGGSCTVDVTFTPTASHLYSGQLCVDSTSPAGRYLVSLSGLGFDPEGNLALGHPITASSQVLSWLGPTNLNDGNPDTYYESANNAFPQSITLDLTTVRAVDRIVLQLPAPWGTRTETVEVQGSTDGSTFDQILAPADYTLDPSVDGNRVTLTFPTTDVRYLRLVVTSNTGWPAAQFSEFEVYAH